MPKSKSRRKPGKPPPAHAQSPEQYVGALERQSYELLEEPAEWVDDFDRGLTRLLGRLRSHGAETATLAPEYVWRMRAAAEELQEAAERIEQRHGPREG